MCKCIVDSNCDNADDQHKNFGEICFSAAHKTNMRRRRTISTSVFQFSGYYTKDRKENGIIFCSQYHIIYDKAKMKQLKQVFFCFQYSRFIRRESKRRLSFK